MKRVGNLFSKIVDVDNLALAAYKAFRGKSHLKVVQLFRENFMDNICKISEETIKGEVDVGNYKQFIIFEPKKRLICAASLRQRVLHHAIMNVCHEIFDRNLIFDCYASRPQKGTHKAIIRVKQKSTSFNYFVKLDIRKFFDSVDHTVLKGLLKKLIKDVLLLQLLWRIIDSYGEGKGLPIGNLTSQYFANYYLSPADHFMKEVVKTPVYVRYMDDVIIMTKEKNEALKYMNYYRQYVNEHLLLQVKAPIVGRVCKGIPFLGYRVFRDKILISGKGKRRFRKNIRILDDLFEKSLITEKEYSERLCANIIHANFADSKPFREKYLG